MAVMNLSEFILLLHFPLLIILFLDVFLSCIVQLLFARSSNWLRRTVLVRYQNLAVLSIVLR